MEIEDQSEQTQEHADDVEITDNLLLLEQELAEDSLAAKLVRAYRDSDDPTDALTQIADQRLEKLRGKYATPVPQDD